MPQPFRRSILRLPLLAVLLALVAGLYTAGPAAADPIESSVAAGNPNPTNSGATLLPGQSAIVTSTANYAQCGPAEGPYPCYSLDGNGDPDGATCSAYGLVCTAPDLAAWALIGRINHGPWVVVGAYLQFTGPGLIELQYNDQDYFDNDGDFTVRVEVRSPGTSGLSIDDITSSPVSVGPGASSPIPFNALPLETPLGNTTRSTLADAPLRSSPLRSSPLRSSPLRSSPLRSSPLRSSPLRSSELGPISLASIPLRSSSWAELLRGTPLDAPPAAITLDQVYALDPLPAGIAALTLDDIDLSRSPLRSSSLAVLLLGSVALTDLEPPVGLSWCEVLLKDPGCDLTGSTLLTVERNGTGIEYANLLIADEAHPNIDISASPLAAMRLDDLELDANSKLSDEDLSGYGTVGDLVAAVPFGAISTLRLGDLLPTIVAPKELPFGAADLGPLLQNAESVPADRIIYTVTTTVPCSATQFRINYRFPYGVRYVPGSTRTTLASNAPVAQPDPSGDEGGGPAQNDFQVRVNGNFSIYCDAPGTTTFTALTTLEVDPPPKLGPITADVTVSTSDDDYSTNDGGATTVTDKYDAGDTEATAATLSTTGLTTGYITPGTPDVDTYKLPAPPVGSTVTIDLSHLPADYDVTVTGPPTGISAAPLRSSPLRSSPLRSSTIGDEQYGGANDDHVTPALLQDLPLRSSPLRSSPLRSSSISRGTSDESATFTVTADDVGKFFYVTVSGYNGASSTSPYLLRTEIKTPPVAPECRPRTFGTLAAGSATFPTSLPSGTKSLLLFNEQRLKQLYPNADIAQLRAQAAALATSVGGALIPIDSDPDFPTKALYDAWDAAPCSEAAANAVAKRIREVIGHVSGNLDNLTSIAIIGGDDVIPQARVQDTTSVANESEEAGSVVFGGKDSALSRSVRDGYLVTDDLYGDFDREAGLGGQTYVPDVALGRLVETPAEIASQLTAFTTAGGALSVSTAHVAGYDFLTDGAQAILSKLSTIPGITTSSSINETWTARDAIDALNRQARGITSVNGHYDHYRGMPAAAFAGLVPNLFSSADITPAAASLVFTAGCHAGLSVSDLGLGDLSTADSARLVDFAQKVGRSGGAYIANTTYGYGDTDTVAYTERLLELLSDNIASQRVTAGQALMLAKQRYAAEQQTPGVYDRKASMGLTYYGLPFFKVGPTGAEGASTVPVAPSGDPAVSSSTFDVSPSFQLHTTPNGQYYTANDEPPQVTHFRPVEPRVILDVTGSAPVHGAVIETLTETSEAFFNVLFSQPVIDDSRTADPTPSFDGVFPVSIQRNTRTGSSLGLRDLLVLAAGQYDDDRGRQSRFTRIAGRVLRSGSTDFDPPTMTNVSARSSNGTATISAFATTNDVVRGVALVNTDGHWQLVELARSGNTWTGSVPLEDGQGISYIIQLVDSAGNVGVSTNKGPGFHAVPSFAPLAANPVVPTDPTTPPTTPATTPVTTPATTPPTTPRTTPVTTPATTPATTPTLTPPIRIDAGSTVATRDSLGNTWAADTGRFTPTTLAAGGSATQAIAGTSDDVIYGTNRSNLGSGAPLANRIFTYTVPTTATRVDVRLLFSESYWTAANKRRFDVYAEGAKVLSNFDIFATAGAANTAVSRTITGVGVVGGVLDLKFQALADFPLISGIEVTCVAGCGTVAPTPPPPAPSFTTSPAPGPTGWFRYTPRLTLNAPGRPGVTYTIYIDDCPPERYTGQFPVWENGRHTVIAMGSDGSIATIQVNTDASPPVVTPVVTPAASPEGFIAGPAKVTWTCTDTPSGVKTCPGAATTLSTETTVTLTSPAATDVAGNTGDGKTAALNIDMKPPTGAIDALGSLKTITVAGKAVKVVSGTAADSLAGNRSVVVTYTSTTTPVKTTTVNATVSCPATTRRACTWTATLPAKGTWRVAAKVTDRAGRVTTITRSETLTAP